MFDIDTLIQKLVYVRQLHGPVKCCASIVDGEGQKIVYSSEPPFVDFHKSPEGSTFVQIVFHGDDEP